jgi:hypothetical protein
MRDAHGPTSPGLADLHRFAPLGRGLEHVLSRQVQIPGGIEGPVDRKLAAGCIIN